MEEKSTNPIQHKNAKRIKNAKIIILIFIELIGLLAIFFSIYLFNGYLDSFPTFNRPEYEYYGGDAYTGIQNSASDTANNVAEAGDLIKNLIYDVSFAFGGLFLIIGLLILTCGAFALIKTIAEAPRKNQSEFE